MQGRSISQNINSADVIDKKNLINKSGAFIIQHLKANYLDKQDRLRLQTYLTDNWSLGYFIYYSINKTLIKHNLKIRQL